jgi:hypothetical protein
VNYQRLVSEPQNTIRSLCSLIRIPYFKGKEKFWEKDHHQVYGSLGTRKQAEKKSSKIRAKENFHPDFKNIAPQIEKDNRQDLELKEIMKKLKHYEMNDNYNKLFIKSFKKPYWYHLFKLKGKVRQRFLKK